MITDDHPVTARRIFSDLGIAEGGAAAYAATCGALGTRARADAGSGFPTRAHVAALGGPGTASAPSPSATGSRGRGLAAWSPAARRLDVSSSSARSDGGCVEGHRSPVNCSFPCDTTSVSLEVWP